MQTWSIDAIVLPYGERTERWQVADGVLHDGPAPRNRAAQALPGRYVLPGLVDAHTHLTLDIATGEGTLRETVDGALSAQFDAGVLAVRDVGAAPGIDVDRGAGRTDRPDAMGGSRYIAPPGTFFPALYERVDPDAAPKAAAAEIEAGAQWVKVIADSPITPASFFDPPPTFEPSQLRAIVDAVHAAGGRVAAHVTGRSVHETVYAGVDSIEHGSLVDDDLLADMAARGTAWTPTAGTVLGGIGQLEAAGAQPLLALARPHLERLRDAVPTAERLGVTVLAGTDMLGHGNLAGEVAALVQLGMSVPAALAAASSVPRTYLGLPTFEPGQVAELVCYDRDPRDDPEVLRSPVAIVHAGVRVR